MWTRALEPSSLTCEPTAKTGSDRQFSLGPEACLTLHGLPAALCSASQSHRALLGWPFDSSSKDRVDFHYRPGWLGELTELLEKGGYALEHWLNALRDVLRHTQEDVQGRIYTSSGRTGKDTSRLLQVVA